MLKINDPFDFTTAITADTTIYAKFEEEVKTWTVTFDTGDTGYYVAPQFIENGNKVTKPGDPYIEGKTFEGWYYVPDPTKPTEEVLWQFDTNTVTSNVELKAHWNSSVSYTVNFYDFENNIISTETVESGESLTNIPDGQDYFDDVNNNRYYFVAWTPEVEITPTHNADYHGMYDLDNNIDLDFTSNNPEYKVDGKSSFIQYLRYGNIVSYTLDGESVAPANSVHVYINGSSTEAIQGTDYTYINGTITINTKQNQTVKYASTISIVID